jgi:DNA-binding response OmpR family regulator
VAYVIAVDDDLEVLETLGRVLEREKLEVKLASSGAQAMTLLEQRIPDLLILDIIMPGMDGIAVCRQLRSNPNYVSLPILFLTAKGSTDDIVEGLDAGADDYVIKPFELAELRARVHALIRRGMRQSASGNNSLLQIDDLVLDSDTYQVTFSTDLHRTPFAALSDGACESSTLTVAPAASRLGISAGYRRP